MTRILDGVGVGFVVLNVPLSPEQPATPGVWCWAEWQGVGEVSELSACTPKKKESLDFRTPWIMWAWSACVSGPAHWPLAGLYTAKPSGAGPGSSPRFGRAVLTGSESSRD
jgi:hypothetical protein